MIDEKKLVEDLEKTVTFRVESYGEDREEICFHWKSVKNMITQQPKIGEWIPCS